MKMQNPSDREPANDEIGSSFEQNVCSTTEMTGLIPAAPEDEAGLHYYNELYGYLPNPMTGNQDEKQNQNNFHD